MNIKGNSFKIGSSRPETGIKMAHSNICYRQPTQFVAVMGKYRFSFVFPVVFIYRGYATASTPKSGAPGLIVQQEF